MAQAAWRDGGTHKVLLELPAATWKALEEAGASIGLSPVQVIRLWLSERVEKLTQGMAG